MKILRNLEKAAGQYQLMLETNQENLRLYKNEYSEDLERLTQMTDDYISSASQEFKMWADMSVEVFISKPGRNIFKLARKKIDMAIINHFLNSLSYKLTKAGKIKSILEKVTERINQFKYWS